MLGLVRRAPLLAYFGGAYAFAAAALVVIGPPRLVDGGTRPMSSVVMFPVVVVGAALSGVAMTAAASGREGLLGLLARLSRWRVPVVWYATLLVLPLGIVAVLLTLRMAVSPAFAPQFFVFGIAFGVVAGFFEEIGWTGFAYPRLRARLGALEGAVVLGLAWGVWHLPVVDSLGAASPHGRYWPAFFAAFVLLVVGIRVLICWIYSDTGSVLLAQVMHASSTGFLVVLSPTRVSAAQESLWYFVSAALIWLIVAGVVAWFSRDLTHGRWRGRPTPLRLPARA